MNEIPKQYNIQEREEFWREFWEKEGIYKFDENSDQPIFSVDTPPPYVSADHLHTGHIMSYSQAEFVVRYKRMKGFNVFYPMGFDDNGLPTERFVEKKYKIDKSKISRSEFVKKCLEETKIGAETYRKLWTLLGISVDWSKTYSTINEHCRKISQWSFLDLYKKNLIYRAQKPALWCTTCQTAISQADLEVEEKDSQLVYIKAKAETGEELVFATTRPELLPACMGISVNPQDKKHQNLIGKKVIMPLTKAEVVMTADEATDMDFGSGIVYYCSYGGGECIEWLARHPESKTFKLILPDGKISEIGGKYAGLTVAEARKEIVEDLKKIGALEKIEPIKHSVFIHERCRTDVEYIETEQWFIKLMDKKKEFLQQGQKLRWFPERWKKSYENWVEGLKWDWCISRQRYYGVPFPVWYCKKCGEIILAEEKNLPVDPLESQPEIKACPKCGSMEFVPESDVMDTWMTSSMTPVIGARLAENPQMQKKLYPATLRPQAFEIIRTWLFYTVAKSYFHDNSIPFHDVMISGHGLDMAGKKISKRLGNYTLPEKIIEESGADALRYWATGATLGENMRYSEEEVKMGKKTITKLWNVFRFAQPHLKNLNPDKNIKVNYEPADRWILNELYETIKTVEKSFETYEYSKAKNQMESFFWNKFTDNYLEFIKYRLYAEDKNSPAVLAAKATLFQCLLAILKMYAPIMPFITEEIYQLLFKEYENQKSIHVSEWPEANESWKVSPEFSAEFSAVIEAIISIRKHKSEKNISLGKEIDAFNVGNKINLEKYGEFIQRAARVKEVTA
ncbi:MAG: valine--tRNA ligase [Candidatus Moranbacteria bacterium]|nr:valine--tRNA ligase [Candidatus Moranbacteria bacterium]